MTFDVDIEALQGTDPVYVIAEEVFAAMVDGESGHLRTWDGPQPSLAEEVHAWVDVHGAMSGRVLLSTEQPTARRITRALLGMTPDEAVGDADLVDALGEVANVVGGNLKALTAHPGALTLPVVTRERPHTDPDALLYGLALDWRGLPLVITLWSLP
jgi:CheY-specific phosphatase CheX